MKPFELNRDQFSIFTPIFRVALPRFGDCIICIPLGNLSVMTQGVMGFEEISVFFGFMSFMIFFLFLEVMQVYCNHVYSLRCLHGKF